MDLDKLTPSVVRVGEGRGFVVQERQRFRKLIVTAAHCLPRLPPAQPWSSTQERTYEDLLAPIGLKPTIWAECLFVDPIGDIAILGEPDGQALCEQWEQYDTLLETLNAIKISDAPEKCFAWLLSLDKRWFKCIVTHDGGGGLWFSEKNERSCGGMSGSPVLLDDGSAIGVICTHEGPNPRLMYNLPGGYLRGNESLKRARRR